jgi:hypothetical protein
MINTPMLDRRNCLKGIGVTLALPLLDSIGWAESKKGSPATGQAGFHVHATWGDHEGFLANQP